LKHNETHHWYECICGEKDSSTEEPHAGGTATCTEKALCSTCNEAYGTTLAHTYNILKHNETHHWYECICGEKDSSTEEPHAGGTATCTEKAICSTCNEAYGTTLAHTYNILKHNETHHWYECTCGEKDSSTEEPHAGGTATCTEKAHCSTCNEAYGTTLDHEFTEIKYNINYHWYECTCGEKDTTTEELHIPSAPATATTPQICTTCNFVIQNETGILFKTLTVDGTNVYGKVSNVTEMFSFINEIEVKGNAKFVVSLDIYGIQTVVSKTIPLEIGDNKVYVTETVDGEPTNLYTVIVRRRPTYEVTFNANGGTAVEKQIIEEDYLATEPTTTRTGYTFTGWDYDFAEPIIENEEITASWSANEDTEYKVEYYLQNIEDDNYTLDHTDTLRGTTDTLATADIKEFDHFTFIEGESIISGNIDGDGSRVLVVKYTRDKYTISTARNNEKAGSVTGACTYKFDKEITLTAITNAGYTFLGWYEGEDLVCESEEFTFNAEKGVTYTATWFTHTDTEYKVEYYLQNLEDDNYT
ncbi:MAG: InlB B-repeat-containing protein, partial [Clostridia bacterium]|nr:InlB B-repeat-containing protein [Clostridia bacterium]